MLHVHLPLTALWDGLPGLTSAFLFPVIATMGDRLMGVCNQYVRWKQKRKVRKWKERRKGEEEEENKEGRVAEASWTRCHVWQAPFLPRLQSLSISGLPTTQPCCGHQTVKANREGSSLHGKGLLLVSLSPSATSAISVLCFQVSMGYPVTRACFIWLIRLWPDKTFTGMAGSWRRPPATKLPAAQIDVEGRSPHGEHGRRGI